MKNSIFLIIIFLFLNIENNYSKAFSPWDEVLPSESYKKDMGIDNEIITPFSNLSLINPMANGDPWRPDPEDGDESGLGQIADTPIGDIDFLVIFLLILIHLYFFKRL